MSFLPGLVLGACFMELRWEYHMRWVGSIPATGVPLREQRFSAKSQPLPSGARRGEPAEVVAARKDGSSVGNLVIS